MDEMRYQIAYEQERYTNERLREFDQRHEREK